MTHCDDDGALDADGTANLCANGQGNCGNRNAVYTNNVGVINLDQLPGVSAILGNGVGAGGTVYTADDTEIPDGECHAFGCGFHAQHGSDAAAQAPLLIDNDHSPGSWSASPNGDSNDCSTRIYATVDLGAIYALSGVTIWHYYGNDRAYCSQRVAVSITGNFNGEEYEVYNSGDGENGPPEAVEGNAFTFSETMAQFVRHWCSRSTSNGGIHMMEIDVYGHGGVAEIVNLDQMTGVAVTAGPGVDDRGNAGSVIDMNHSPGAWVNSPTGGFDDCAAGNSLYLTIDLGDYYLVTGVTIWHYYGNDRSYCSQAVALSATGDFAGEEYVAYATGDGVQGPPESVDGNAITFAAYVSRYVRHWSGRSTANSGVHFLEIGVYGLADRQPPPPSPNPAFGAYVGCFRDNEGGRDLTGTGSQAVASTPAAAAAECATLCSGFAYFGLQWTSECFCDNSYANGNGNNANQGDCPNGECPMTHCDADGALDADGTASLCANGQGNCGNRNAVYNVGVPVTFQYVGCFRDNEGGRDMTGNGGSITAVASVPVDAATECATVCDGYTYFGLQWVNECFCDNGYNNGNGNNGNQGNCPGGECPITDCDADGAIDADGTADLCANGQGNCGNRNAVYAIGGPTFTSSGSVAVLQFTSDGSVTRSPGPLEAVFSCGAPAPAPEPDACAAPIAITDADTGSGQNTAMDYDAGHGNAEDCQWIMTCADASQTPVVIFHTFNTETNFDYVNIYDGPDVSAPRIV